MAKTKKIGYALFWLLVTAAVINGAYIYLGSRAITNETLTMVATILSPVMVSFNYIVVGVGAGLGFYIAKELVEK